MKKLMLVFISAIIVQPVMGEEQIYRTDNVKVTYERINDQYIVAIAKTAEAARSIAVKAGFNLPETIYIEAILKPRGRARLFTDGKDYMSLTVTDVVDLAGPEESGIFHIYGICHEVGHLAMYRVIRDHSWMTTAAAEGWAHYMGSKIVDEVHALHGNELWPDKHKYLGHGTARLKKQLASKKPSDIAKGAGLWMQLSEIISDSNVPKVFEAWAKTKIDPADPGSALRKALLQIKPEDKRLSDFWNRAEPVLIRKRPRSGFALRQAELKDLAKVPVNLEHDDSKQSGKSSIAGGGHIVRFSVPGHGWYLTNIRIYGQRYGYPRPPQEDFKAWLCDKDFKAIAEFAFPYSTFRSTKQAKWANLKIKPTNVPSEFIICVGFNPTNTRGVFLGYDAEGSGNSFTGLPGKPGRSFSKGDWLIKIRVDQLKSADALREIKK